MHYWPHVSSVIQYKTSKWTDKHIIIIEIDKTKSKKHEHQNKTINI